VFLAASAAPPPPHSPWHLGAPHRPASRCRRRRARLAPEMPRRCRRRRTRTASTCPRARAPSCSSARSRRGARASACRGAAPHAPPHAPAFPAAGAGPRSQPNPRRPCACSRTATPGTKQNDRLTGKCVYFTRVNPRGVSEKTFDVDMAAGDIVGPGALGAFRALVNDIYLPLLQARRRGGAWAAGGCDTRGVGRSRGVRGASGADLHAPPPLLLPGPPPPDLAACRSARAPQEQSGWGKMPQDHTRDFLEGAGEGGLGGGVGGGRLPGCRVSVASLQA
jgi:hypothetical protein